MLRYQITYHARRNCRPLSKTCKRVTLETTTEQERLWVQVYCIRYGWNSHLLILFYFVYL